MTQFNQPLGGNEMPRFGGPSSMMRLPAQTAAEGFRRAWEDECLLNDKVFQISLRGTGYAPEDFDWGRDQGWTVIQAKVLSFSLPIGSLVVIPSVWS